MHGSTLFILCAVAAAGFACQWLAWRLRLPSILLLLVVGIAAGPIFGWLRPDELFGDLLVPIVSMAVAVILFEGALTLKFDELGGHGTVVRNLVSLGTMITWVVAASAAMLMLGWDLYLAALFGAVVTVSGPTVVIPLLRTVRPNAPLANVIRWEGILIDPIGAILALLVFDFIIATQTAAGASEVAVTMGLIAGVGLGLGALGGYLFGILIRKRLVPDFLRDYGALAAVLLVFGISETLESESGLLAVTVMGVWLANMPSVELEDVLDFKESLTLILVAALFIVLAARLDLANLVGLGAGAIIVLLVLQLIAGPLRAAFCTIGSALNWRERLFLGWMFPRGIVAAAVSALFALRLEQIDYTNAGKLVPLVFSVIIGTVVIQSLTARRLARWLNVADPDPDGVLIVGANPVALLFARALHETGRDVLVADNYWANIREARMAGLRTFYGSAVSSYADRHLDLVGIGHLLAVSRRPDLNQLACVRFAQELGRDNVFFVNNESDSVHEKHNVSTATSGRVLYEAGMTVSALRGLLDQGAEVKTTEITDEFSFEDYRSANPDAVILFITGEKGELQFPTADGELSVGAGDKVTALRPANDR